MYDYNKLFIFDCETTGLDKMIHDPHQIACIVETNGHKVAEEVFYSQPVRYDTVQKEALEISHTDIDTLHTYPPSRETFCKLRFFMNKYINPYERGDKFTAVGQHVRFDMGMIDQWFRKHGDNYFYSMVDSHDEYDIVEMTKTLKNLGFMREIENNKLETICRYLRIHMANAHNAICDIRSTYTVFQRYRKIMHVLAQYLTEGPNFNELETMLRKEVTITL